MTTDQKCYFAGAEDMRSHIIRRMRDIEKHWIALRDGYDPHGQWEDRQIAVGEIEHIRAHIALISGFKAETELPGIYTGSLSPAIDLPPSKP